VTVAAIVKLLLGAGDALRAQNDVPTTRLP
jgi:hypothetical protein